MIIAHILIACYILHLHIDNWFSEHLKIYLKKLIYTYAKALSEIMPILLLISRSDSICVPCNISFSTVSISDDMTSMWLIRVPIATSKKQTFLIKKWMMKTVFIKKNVYNRPNSNFKIF